MVGVSGASVPASHDGYAATREDARFTRELGDDELADDVFRRTVELEVAFFDAAYDSDAGAVPTGDADRQEGGD